MQQAIPKFEYTLSGHRVYIPAVLFHFPNPREMVVQIEKKLTDFTSRSGVCLFLLHALEDTPSGQGMLSEDQQVKLTYSCINRALSFADHEFGGQVEDSYLENHFFLRHGISRRPDLTDLRIQWIRHIQYHLEKQA